MLKLLDRYIIRKFLGTFAFTIALIVVIAVVFDLTEKVDDIFEKGIPVSELVGDYYLNFIPYFANLFTPLFVFIAAIFFTSKLANQYEIVAMLSSGFSFWRLLKPYMIAAGLVAFMSFVLYNFVIPRANEGRLAFEYKYLKHNRKKDFLHLHREIRPNTFIYLESYSQMANTGSRFTMETFRNQKMQMKLSADQIHWDSLRSQWNVRQMTMRKFRGEKESLRKVAVLDTALGFSPVDILLADDDVERMNFFELNAFIEREKNRGSEFIDYYILEKHRRFANPAAIFILTLIALAMSSRKVRGGIGLHIGLGIGLSFSYIMLNQISSVFAVEGGVNPALAAWIPNLIFLVLAGILLRNAPK
jgi:lipopolysaccharide export system permease protein